MNQDKRDELNYDIMKQLKRLNYNLEMYNKVIMETLIHIQQFNRDLQYSK